MFNLKVIELTKDNEEMYLDQLDELEKVVLENLVKQGREGQLFITGKEDISEYVHSKENTVMIAVDKENNVKAATYITQGQVPFTYNDITKYFKYGKDYQDYVRKSYVSEYDYKRDMLDVYKIKLEAFKYAKDKILLEHPEYEGDIIKFLNHELNDSQNQFHEKSELRENLNKFMSQYVAKKENEGSKDLTSLYEKFYWVTSDEIASSFAREIDINMNPEIKVYEDYMKQEQEEYKNIMKKGRLKIYEKSKFDEEKYFGANTKNSVEIDTYITHPLQRSTGTARILVYEGIKKHIVQHFENPENKEIYLCSTLHRDNLSSKYVSEFFGLKDNLYLNRRQGRDREVHICKIEKEKANEYLNLMEDKLIVLYGYNPYNKYLTPKRKVDILEGQMKYEKEEFERLNGVKAISGKFTSQNLDGLNSKLNRINRINNLISKYKEMENKKGMDYDREI